MNIKKIFFILVATLMACIACTRQQDAIEPEVTSQIIEVESIPEIETPAPTSTVTPVVTAIPVAVEEQQKMEKLPKGAKLFLDYSHYGENDYSVYKKGETFYFCYNKEVLTKTVLKDEIKSMYHPQDPLWPFAYSKKGNLYIVQANKEQPMLEFVQVAQNAESIGFVLDADMMLNFYPIYRDKKTSEYKTVIPKSRKAYNQYAQWEDMENGISQTAEYGTIYKTLKMNGKKNILTEFYLDKNAWNARYYFKYNGKKYNIWLETLPQNGFFLNNFVNKIIQKTDKKASRQLKRFTKEILLKKAKDQSKKIEKFLKTWEEENTEKIYKYYKSSPKRFKKDWKTANKSGLKNWLEKHPAYKEKLKKLH